MPTDPWTKVLTTIESKLGLDVRRAWFDELRSAGLGRNGALRIGAPTPFWAYWMRTHYERQTLAAAKSHWPNLNHVTFFAYGRQEDMPTRMSSAPSLLSGLTPRSQAMAGERE